MLFRRRPGDRAWKRAAKRRFSISPRGELVGLYGGDFARRVAPIAMHGWSGDPFARGAYSYALPGHADDRAVFAAPVDGRLFFAGEACSRADFSTAHGAYLTGIAAAEQAIKALTRRDR